MLNHAYCALFECTVFRDVCTASQAPVKGDAHADAFAEGVDNVTVRT